MRVLAIVALATACNGFDAVPQPVGRAHPIANAGTGSSYPLGTTVPLDGSRSFDPGGTIVAYRWSITQHPSGSVTQPADPNASITSFVPDQLGTYRLRLKITDDAQNIDSSEIRIVATGAITSIDAGPDATASWLRTAQLAGAVALAPGELATYAWSFVSRPPGSTATITNATTLTPTFVADATGTYIVALDAAVGDDVREDTVMIEVTAAGIAVGTGIAAYVYSQATDRIVYAHDVGHAELVRLDPVTGTQVALDVGAFTPRSLSIDQLDQYVAVGGPGTVATVSISSFLLASSRSVPGCSANHVTIPASYRVDCYPADGAMPISSVSMATGEVTQISCPLALPELSGVDAYGHIYMVDGASSQIFMYDAFSTPALAVLLHGSLAGIAPPVIAIDASQTFALTGNGLAVFGNGALDFDLHVPVAAAALAGLHDEIAVLSGATLKVFGLGTGQPLKLSAVLPTVNGIAPTPKLVAYSSDNHRLIIVAGTADGDVAYSVPR